MEDLENKYLDNLRNECQRIILTNEMRIIEFLYKVIYNRDYFGLTKYDEKYYLFKQFNSLENQLDHKICEQILYPLKSDTMITIQQAIILIPGFASFFMGSNIILNQIIHNDSTQFWDIFMNACAFKVNLNNDKYFIEIAKFQELLQIEKKQYLTLSLQQCEQLIDNFLQPTQLLKLLNAFFQDCFLFNVQIKYEIKKSSYLQFLGEKKKKHFLKFLQFLIDHFQEELTDSYDFQKLKIAQSFILKDYSQNNIFSQIDLYTHGMIIYSLIEYDYKQFTCILNFLSNQEKIQIIERITGSVKDYNSEYIKLVLAAKCLKNVGDWEQSEMLFQLLLNKKQETTKKYGVYIYLSLAKLSLFQGDLKNSLSHNSKAIQIIDQFNQSQLDYYKPNMNKDLLIEALMRQIVLAVYLNKKIIIETTLIRIKNIISESDLHHHKRPVILIFQRFIQLLSQCKQPYNKNEKKALQDFSTIQTKINELLQYRVQYVMQSNASIKIGIGIFHKLFQKNQQLNEQTYFPSKIYQLYSQLMIFNALLFRLNMPEDIYYFDSRYYQILYKIIKNTDLYNDSIKSQLFFNLSHFDDALEIAKKLKDHKLLGQIYEYQGNFEEALNNYQKVFDTDCYFNIANIMMINGKYSQAESMLNRLKQLSPQYQKICERYILKAQQNQSYSLFFSQRRNNLVGSITDSDIPLRKARTNEFIKIEQPRIQNVETILEDDPEIENNRDSMNQTTEIPAFQNEFQFQLRDDIQYFYQNLMNTCWNKSQENVQTLKDFVINTRYLETESVEFFNEEKFQVGQRIGSVSSQGKVNLVTYLGKQFASKITSFSFQATGENIRKEHIDAMKERLFEIIIQSRITQLNYPYTPHLRHLGFYFKKVGEDKVIRIFTLTDYFKPSSIVHTFDIERKIDFCFKLAIILNMIQTDLKIIHQDLKPDNILVSEYDPVLIDYGISQKHIVSQKTQNFQEATARYQDQQYYRTKYKSKKNDVYSFGVTIYNLITNECPFPDKTREQLIAHEFDFLQYHEAIISKIENVFLQNLIKRCTSNFNERPYFSEVIYLFLEYLFEHQDLINFLKMLSFNFRTCNLSLQNIEAMKIILKNYPEYQLPQQVNLELKSNFNETISQVVVNQEEMLVLNYKIQFKNNQCNMEIVYQQIYQYVQMIANWIILKSNPNIAKLRYFSIKNKKTAAIGKQNQYELIQITFYLKQWESLTTQIINWKQLISQMLNGLKDAHKLNDILLNIPKYNQFSNDQQLMQAGSSMSQNIKMPLIQDNIEPFIIINSRLSNEHDIYALKHLLKSLFPQNSQEIDQFLPDFDSFNNGHQTAEMLSEKIKQMNN